MTILDLRPVYDIRPINFNMEMTARTASPVGVEYMVACTMFDIDRACEIRFGEDASLSDMWRVLTDMGRLYQCMN